MLLGDSEIIEMNYFRNLQTIKTMLPTNLAFIQFTTSKPAASRSALLGTKMMLTY